MENRLKKLKQSMKSTVFQDLTFNEKQKEAIRKNVKQENYLENIMQLLVTERTGMDLIKLLRARRITRFEEQEGFIYTILHELEQEGLLTHRWDESEYKFYILNRKGLKLLRKMEKSSLEILPLLQRLVLGEGS
ncbi:PadR family transcriptional regulator [Neobacillus sp. PS3-34]|uniref:PadR family transcriptional regulator n=1 Tax=Neobacillus sp. PS3-34 TaxID=3070678 RepID=UPI0027DEB61C|nr:PadR family transcriptional regulator [Neobacillus sp. PS3-34]WML48010.1 PadR family transcriptional regulator [Neobacillus sp. PS3-34]